MSVIAEFRVPAADFEIGRILSLDEGMTAALELAEPIGLASVPYLWLEGAGHQRVVDRLKANGQVDGVFELDRRAEGHLYAVDWDPVEDPVFRYMADERGQLLRAIGRRPSWELAVRFPSHDALDAFQGACHEDRISVRTDRLYNPTRPEAGPWFGVTDRQRAALELAVDRGYYDIPRRITTVELANDLGISDQAVTERLRRGIGTLVRNSLLAADE